MVDLSSSSHEHDVQVSCTWNDDGDCFTRYACFDPTCDWCVTELTGSFRRLIADKNPKDLTDAEENRAIQPATFRDRASGPSDELRGGSQCELLLSGTGDS